MKRDQILKVLKDGKRYYLHAIQQEDYIGMCVALSAALKRNGVHTGLFAERDIREYIPEYNRKFCGVVHNNNYWWDLSDIESRIKAFDKLIEYYSKPTLTERIINSIKQYGKKCIFWK